MDLLVALNHKRKLNRYPNELFKNLESKHYSSPAAPAIQQANDGWVIGRFSPSLSHEHILFLGDDPGNVGIYDVSKFVTGSDEDKLIDFFPAHDGTIMDIVGVPNKPSNIITLSGDSTIRGWDLNHSTLERTSELFFGHDGSVRSVDFVPDNSNVFVSGSRDGQIKVWDMRVSKLRQSGEDCRKAVITYKCAHPLPEIKSATPKSKRKKPAIATSVTSALFVNEFKIASASSTANTGIRMWDMRNPVHREEPIPCEVYNVPVAGRKDGFGVTCLAVDRFRSSMFASCTNSYVYEYSVSSSGRLPERIYSGAVIRDYYTQVKCSPISDHFACGSYEKRALIWDSQDYHDYANDVEEANEVDKRRSLLPKWSLGGHDAAVLCVDWSASAKYFISLDDGGVRLWTEKQPPNRWSCCDEDKAESKSGYDPSSGLLYEDVKEYELSVSDSTTNEIDGMCLVTRPRANSITFSSPKKSERVAKRPLSSPFKSPSKKLGLSPRAKISKIATLSPSKSLLNQLNVINSGGNDCKTPRNKNTIRRPFYYSFPTENLPNYVYDRFVSSLIGNEPLKSRKTTTNMSKSCRKRIEDWWSVKSKENHVPTRTRLPSVSEFGESVCSKVMTEQERNMLSPRKLVVKNNKIDSTSKSSSKKVVNSPISDTSKSANRRTNRNLLHYFNKKTDDS